MRLLDINKITNTTAILLAELSDLRVKKIRFSIESNDRQFKVLKDMTFFQTCRSPCCPSNFAVQEFFLRLRAPVVISFLPTRFSEIKSISSPVTDLLLATFR